MAQDCNKKLVKDAKRLQSESSYYRASNDSLKEELAALKSENKALKKTKTEFDRYKLKDNWFRLKAKPHEVTRWERLRATPPRRYSDRHTPSGSQ